MRSGQKKSPSKGCMCDRCGVEAHSIAGKVHRRCSGQEGQPIRAKYDPVVPESRGKWS
ncbi:MAG TPA: hypothetical protein VII94_04560 [Candidatus Saccharimonadales bacterium]